MYESQATGHVADACHTCMQPHYDCFDRPAGSNDVTLGPKMGQGCQLKCGASKDDATAPNIDDDGNLIARIAIYDATHGATRYHRMV